MKKCEKPKIFFSFFFLNNNIQARSLVEIIYGLTCDLLHLKILFKTFTGSYVVVIVLLLSQEPNEYNKLFLFIEDAEAGYN